MIFKNRSDAGKVLATHLKHYAGRSDVVVLALPRGGVPVAFEVAKALGAPLDLFLVRKLGLPGYPELAMGALASGGVVVMNEEVVNLYGVSEEAICKVKAAESKELERREEAYRGKRVPLGVAGRTVILIDDGLATGATMKAAVAALRSRGPARIVVAIPTAPAETCEELRKVADEVICATTPRYFFAVGASYEDFTQTSDEEVRDLLERAASKGGVPQ